MYTVYVTYMNFTEHRSEKYFFLAENAINYAMNAAKCWEVTHVDIVDTMTGEVLFASSDAE